MAGDQFGEHSSYGHKRHADDELEVNHGISTHFKKLRIDHATPRARHSGYVHRHTGAPTEDYMPVDETKDRIIIHDLEAEIAEIEAAEPKTMFLPDIDKKVSAIPQRLLQNQSGNTNNTQMILYEVPTSISVPKEKDAVRKAIIAARARAREEQARELGKEDIAFAISEAVTDEMPVEQPTIHHMYDPDAMDIG